MVEPCDLLEPMFHSWPLKESLPVLGMHKLRIALKSKLVPVSNEFDILFK